MQGYKAGETAAERASGQRGLEADESSLRGALSVLEGFLGNQGGVRVAEATRELETISDEALGMMRSEQSLRAGIDRYERLERRLQTLSLAGKSMRYNRELMAALSLRNLLTCSKLAAKMAMERKESRGLHLREDYPYIDNAEWQVRQLAQLTDGTDRIWKKEPVVTRIPARKAEKVDYETFILEEDLGMKNMEEQ